MWNIAILLTLTFCMGAPLRSQTLSFQHGIELIKKHNSVLEIKHQAMALKHSAAVKGSSGDPLLKLSAKNFPIQSLKNSKTPMTGIALDISKKIALSTKYSNKKSALLAGAKARLFDSKKHTQNLIKAFWGFLIQQKRIGQEKIIITKNLKWIKNILKVSQKLYGNGRLSQRAILDIQIRKAELEMQLSNNGFAYKEVGSQLRYLLGSEKISTTSIPWNILNIPPINKNNKDYQYLSLQKTLDKQKYNLTAAKLNYIPDLNISLGFTKRNKVHLGGDLVSLSVSFPLPFSATQYAQHRKAFQKKRVAINQLHNYKKQKSSKAQLLQNSINKINSELSILNKKSIIFAKNYRTITAKSYTLGRSSYIELLQAELKLQNLSLQKILLGEKKDTTIVALKYLLGDKLHD